MLDELNPLEAPSAATQPHLARDLTNVPRSSQGAAAFDIASSSKAAVARALPGWFAERQRLNRDRIRRPETTRGDRLVITLVRTGGVGIAVGVAVVAAALAYSATGLMAGIAVGVVTLTVALAAVSAATVLTRAIFDRSERMRRETVARLEDSIRLLDERISQAFRYHGLVRHARTRSSF